MLKKNNPNINKKCVYILLLFIVIGLIKKIQIIKNEKKSNSGNKCYLSFDKLNLKIIHVIITRFLSFPSNYRTKEYILNGIRVMKEYLLPSLENQSCKDFIWVLMLGNNKANITSVKTLFNFNSSFQCHIIYRNDTKNFLRNITKGFDILITTRMDYDDRIYYDAVNDVRKLINTNKPMLFHGYKRGVFFFEIDKKYYDFEYRYNNGSFSVFESLILNLNKVNDTYTIYDFGHHFEVREKLFQNFKSYGIQEINYEPALFEDGAPKYVWVRQNYSFSYKNSKNKQDKKMLKEIYFNLSKFYGK